MSESNKICVKLYGGKNIFGGKETPLRAETIYCDKYNNCSLYKKGECLNVTSPFGHRCIYGSVSVSNGYTSRAKKYYDFKNKYTSDKTYNKLNYPSNLMIFEVNDMVMLDITYCGFKEDAGFITLIDPIFGKNYIWIKKEEFTIDLIHKICTFRPHAMMGGEITEYQKKVVPEFLLQLRNNFTQLYNDLIKEYIQFDKAPNYIGKMARLNTLSSGTVKKESDRYPELNSEWYWDGEYMNYVSGFIDTDNLLDRKNMNEVVIKYKPNDNLYVTITDNDMVNDNTIFK